MGNPHSHGRLEVDRRLCRGTGLCQAMCPELFEVTSAGYSVPRQTLLSDPDQIEAAEVIAACCPTEAITVSTHTSDTSDPSHLSDKEGSRDARTDPVEGPIG